MRNNNQGFTLIELLIVVAIIAIIAAVAIPNLMQAHMSANESNAVVKLREYAEAQKKFKAGNHGALADNSPLGGANGYASDYSLLRYGHNTVPGPGGTPVADENSPLNLIEKDFADARGASGSPCHGYLFGEPDGADAIENFWSDRFALLAVPSVTGRTGARALYIDDQGVLLMKDLPSESKAAESLLIDTPVKSDTGWITH